MKSKILARKHVFILNGMRPMKGKACGQEKKCVILDQGSAGGGQNDTAIKRHSASLWHGGSL